MNEIDKETLIKNKRKELDEKFSEHRKEMLNKRLEMIIKRELNMGRNKKEIEEIVSSILNSKE